MIASLGMEAGGCDAVYLAQGAAPGMAVTIRIAEKPVSDARQGRGSFGPATQKRMVVTFMIAADTAVSGLPVGSVVKNGDFFDVPGHKVGRPAESTVRVAVGRDVRLVENAYWTGELAV